MNYAALLQAAPLREDELRDLCEQLAPEPGAPPPPPPPTGALDPEEILTGLRTASAHLVLEEGLLESLAAAVSQGHVILTGPPGTAKSTLANLVAEVVKGSDWISATATAEWSVHDVVGGYMPGADKPLVFEPGLVLDAFKEGRWLVVDELNRADIDKAFGELFTLLSDFPISLPYRDPESGQRIVVAPSGGTGDFVAPADWRLLGTMNTWDKTSLFRLSYAFMRRFAFIEVGVPPEDTYEELIGDFIAQTGVELSEEATLALYSLFAGPALRDLQRELGPAVVKSVVEHTKAGVAAGLAEGSALIAAVRARVLPQFEGAFEAHDSIAAAIRESLVDIGGMPSGDVDGLIRSLSSWTGGGLPGAP
jgi:MoxR-like ATPase